MRSNTWTIAAGLPFGSASIFSKAFCVSLPKSATGMVRRKAGFRILRWAFQTSPMEKNAFSCPTNLTNGCELFSLWSTFRLFGTCSKLSKTDGEKENVYEYVQLDLWWTCHFQHQATPYRISSAGPLLLPDPQYWRSSKMETWSLRWLKHIYPEYRATLQLTTYAFALRSRTTGTTRSRAYRKPSVPVRIWYKYLNGLIDGYCRSLAGGTKLL